MNGVADLFAAALEQHQAGRLQEAGRFYQQVLAADPSHAGANNNLGLLLMEQGQLDQAESCFRRVIAHQADYPEVHNNLGTVLVSQGRLDEALAAFDWALMLRPNYAEAHAGRGNVFKEQGKLGEFAARFREAAVACYQRAVKLNPGLTNVHCNLGMVFREQGRLEAAADSFRQALHCDPTHAEASFGLGSVLQEQSRSDEAVTCYRRAIQFKPDYAAAYVNLAAALHGQQNWPEITAHCRKAIELRPDYAEAHLNLAIALHHQRKLDEATTSCDRALELDPRSAAGYSARGEILKGMAKLEEAVVAYQRAIELKADFSEAHSACVYALYFCPGYDSPAIFEEHRRWNERHAAPLAKLIQPHENDRSTNRRLRIGYVSPDFRDHCQSFFTLPLLSHHNHDAFEIICYSRVNRRDDVTGRLESRADKWWNVAGWTPERLAALVREDKIDILVDLTMHMADGIPLLFARKPAPVQVCWLAYPGTTGLTAMDYRISDPHLDPVGMFEQYYSEETVRLPHSFWCYDPLTSEPAVNRLPALENGYVTFGCLNNFCKVNEGVLRLWGRLMLAVERSRLILLAPEGSSRERVLAVLGKEGVAEEGVTFAPFQSRADYLKTYQQIDIGLETLPYNGHTTSLDSFWMGVPVPTIVGQTVVGRAGASLLQNLGLPELIAQTPDEYVRVVSDLASNWERLPQLRAGLRQRMKQSPLMDGKRFARDMEAAYRGMWRTWCEEKA